MLEIIIELFSTHLFVAKMVPLEDADAVVAFHHRLWALLAVYVPVERKKLHFVK